MSSRNDEAPYADNVCLEISNTGVHLEYIEQFGQSFFRSVYKTAFRQLNDIINRNFQSNNYYQRSNNYKEYYLAVRSNSGGKYESCPNIITFAGRRGSGKTSAMLSFMEALKDYYRYIKSMKNEPFYAFHDMNNNEVQDILFTCLDCIDGSLLEHGEDIFKIVLAQMYQKFIDLDRENLINKEYNFNQRKRELLQQLEDIYRTVCEVEDQEKRQTAPGQSYMSSLRSLSSSQKVKRDFEKLICDFTSLMKYEQKGILQESNEHYVVIAIDDIDLNISNGFSMLEKIHRYCMVPNVIVLLSVDIDQMLSIVFKNFFKVLPKVDRLLLEGEGRVHKLAMDYLEKVMPVNYRSYIPDMSDFLSSHNLSMNKEKADIKKSILRKLYRRTGICFDSQGTKRHFYEPKSMRQLTCFYLMLESMGYVGMERVCHDSELSPEEPREIVRMWEDNYWSLIEDLSNRTVFDKLFAEKDVTELCRAIRKENISFAKIRVIDFCAKNKEKKSGNDQTVKIEINQKTEDDQSTKPGKNRKAEISEKDYDYGTLLETVYKLGHQENGKYKPLEDYLLGYFSYAFTREYIYEKLAIKCNGKVLVKKGRFKEFAGTIISKEWSNALLPNAFETKDEDTGLGEARRTNRFQSFLLDYADLKDVLMAPVFSIELKAKEEFVCDQVLDYDGLFQYAAETIRNLEVLFLFFNGYKEDKQDKKVDINIKDIEWKFELSDQKMSEEKRLDLKPEVNGQTGISILGSYNVLNFVGNSMDAVDILKEFERNLIDCLAEEYLLYKIDAEGNYCKAAEENDGSANWELNPDFQKKLKAYSIRYKYLEWEKKFGKKSLPLPIYWFDFTYNILERTMRYLTKEITVSAELNRMFSFIQRVYKDIERRLGEQQDYYSMKPEKTSEELNRSEKSKDKGPDPDDYQLLDRFRECPAVGYFLSADDRKTDFIGQVMIKLQKYRKK